MRWCDVDEVAQTCRFAPWMGSGEADLRVLWESEKNAAMVVRAKGCSVVETLGWLAWLAGKLWWGRRDRGGRRGAPKCGGSWG